MSLPARPMPKPTAQVEPFFEVLGPELTVAFLLQFGGSPVSYSRNPQGRSEVEKLIGPEKTRKLAESTNRALQQRVPLAHRWLAKMLHWQGHSYAYIARTLRVTDVSVRGWLRRKDD